VRMLAGSPLRMEPSRMKRRAESLRLRASSVEINASLFHPLVTNQLMSTVDSAEMSSEAIGQSIVNSG